jgi:hypothetical protein
MNSSLNPLIVALRKIGWHVQERATECASLPVAIVKRYNEIPKDYMAFLSQVALCSNPSETAWFLCEAEYLGSSNAAFHWNEYELLSLQAASEDSEWEKEIQGFWNVHFPIFMSVKGEYSYLAICLQKDNYGSVVMGCGPEFEEASTIAPSFSSFADLLIGIANGYGTDNVISKIL